VKVKDVMTTNVRTCFTSDSLATAAQLMWDHDCGCVPVLNEHGRVVGMLTDRDICMAAFFQGMPIGEIKVSAQGFFNAVVEQAGAQGLLSNQHFTVDGTLIEAWAGHKSFKRKGDDQPTPPDDPGNPSVNFHGERRSNATHQSTTDPEARLARKGPGKEARLCYAGHVQMDNRHGLVVNTRLTQASGNAEPIAALAMAAEITGQGRVTLGADKGYDHKELVRALREHRVTPHVAQKVHSAIDRRSTRHPGYRLSQWRRKRVEEIFGWLKTVAGLRKTRHRGIARVGWTFTFAAAAYNLVRMRNLLPVAT
jgi:Transposase DDE domain/CBS domain